MPEYASKPAVKAKKPAKKAGTPCAYHPMGEQLIDEWRGSSGSTPMMEKQWSLATHHEREAEQRACYSWLYEPTATEQEIDTYGMKMLQVLVEGGYEMEAKEFMGKHMNTKHLFEHLKEHDVMKTIEDDPLGTYVPTIAENARKAIVSGDFEYGNELLSVLLSVLVVRLIEMSRSEPVGTDDDARKELDAAARGLKAVVALYPKMIREYVSTGEPTQERVARDGWDDFKRRIHEFEFEFANFPAFYDNVGFANPQVRIVDAMFINNDAYHHTRHRKWTLVGMDADSLPVPVAPFNSQFDDLDSVPYESSVVHALETLVDQQDLLLQLYDVPTVRSRFPKGLPDMYDRNQRISVWAAVFAYFQSSGEGDPERMTMFLIERYLKSYTRHSEFNISDFGDSFIERDYPRSLFGRVMQDCGVYAMSVASELYAALESEGVKGYEFIIYFVPAHVMMIMIKEDHFYAINNDEISGPYSAEGMSRAQSDAVEGARSEGLSSEIGEGRRVQARDDAMYERVAQLNANMDGLEWWGSPMTGVSLGTTGTMSSAAFDEGAWKKYEKAAQHVLDHQSDSGAIRRQITDVNDQLKSLKTHLSKIEGDSQKQIEFLIAHADVVAALFNSVGLLTLSNGFFFLTTDYYAGRSSGGPEESLAPHLSEVMGAAGGSGIFVANGSSLRTLMTMVDDHSIEINKLISDRPTWLLEMLVSTRPIEANKANDALAVLKERIDVSTAWLKRFKDELHL